MGVLVELKRPASEGGVEEEVPALISDCFCL